MMHFLLWDGPLAVDPTVFHNILQLKAQRPLPVISSGRRRPRLSSIAVIPVIRGAARCGMPIPR